MSSFSGRMFCNAGKQTNPKAKLGLPRRRLAGKLWPTQSLYSRSVAGTLAPPQYGSGILRNSGFCELPREAQITMSIPQYEIRVKGRNVRVPSAQIDGRTVISSGKWLKSAVIHDEELIEGETVADPESFLSRLKQTGLNADIFTFAQRLPDTTPRHSYHMEWDNLAIVRITAFSDWWDKRVESSVRRAVRKAAKSGVEVRLQTLDESFVEGIVGINNETPIRQGKAFWHFQKSFDDVKLENSTYPERNAFLGAYYQGEMIGFIRMIYTEKVANIIQLLSMVKHYDKRPAN